MDKKVTLKELVQRQDIVKHSDLELIKKWFIDNNAEQEGLTIIADLSKSKADKLETVLYNARLWIPNLPSTFEPLNTQISEEFAKKFGIIVNIYLLDMPLEGELLKWAKETFPKYKTPTVIFRPALEWLKDKYSIEFKDKLI